MAYPGILRRLLELTGTFTRRRVNASSPLTGGGALSSDISIGIASATTGSPGAVRLATTTEALTGSSQSIALTPACLNAHNTSNNAHKIDFTSLWSAVNTIRQQVNNSSSGTSNLQSQINAILDRLSALEHNSGGANPDPTPPPASGNTCRVETGVTVHSNAYDSTTLPEVLPGKTNKWLWFTWEEGVLGENGNTPARIIGGTSQTITGRGRFPWIAIGYD